MKRNFGGFTFLELSIVITIMGILFIGSFEASKYFMTQNNVKATIVKLNTIQNALDIYVIENGKLPCPAGLKAESGDSSNTCSTTNSSNGIYVSSENGIVSGAVPYEELNLTPDVSHDAWNGKIIYSVSIEATNDIRRMDNSSYKGIRVYQDTTSKLITDRAIYSLVSNGKNRLGAFSFKTNSQLSHTGINNNEEKNIGGNYINENVYFNNYKTNDKVNDDMLKYKTRMQLLNDAKLEDINCYIGGSTITNLLNSNNISGDISFTISGENYLNYNDEIKSTNNEYIIKCFKYGRLGIFKNED